MHEDPLAAASSSSIPPIKRYTPPNQRNRTLNRRKSGGDRFDRTSNLHSSDGVRNLSTVFRHTPNVGHGDAGSGSSLKGSLHTGLISLNGCSKSQASQLLCDRWEAAIHCYNDPSVDLSERPVMYMGSPPAWGGLRLPQEIIPRRQMDFLAELERAMQNRNANSRT